MTRPPQQAPWTGRFVWHDLMTPDAVTAARFYRGLLGWRIQEVAMPGHHYRMIVCGQGPIGGITERKDQPPHWLPHVAVRDVEAASRQAAELGGSVRVPPTEIRQTGRFAIVADPQGAEFSLYQGLPGVPRCDPDLGVPGRACWNELYTSDDAAAQRFYGAMFGWQDEPKDLGPQGTYHTQMLGGQKAGGLMRNPMPDTPSRWVVYFHVVDVLQGTRQAKQLGATALLENVPIPGVGRFSMLNDPTGAMFTLFEPAPAPR